MLALAAIVLLCWCVGRLLKVFRMKPTLVSRITEAKFAALLRQGGIDQQGNSKVAVTVSCYLLELQGMAVPPLPEDDLIWDLGLTEGQVEETVADLARRLHRSATPDRFTKPPHTVEDLATLLQACPRRRLL